MKTITVVTMGVQGPAGPPGPQGATDIYATAGGALGGHRVVFLDSNSEAQYASNQTASHAYITLGITLGAAVQGGAVTIQTYGELVEPSWNWTLNLPIFLDTNGLLTQTAPVSPAVFQRILGFPLSVTGMFISLRDPIFLT